MKGSIIIPREARDFEVAHRIEAGVHWLEVSVGSSFNELYWDVPVHLIVADPQTYDDLVEILSAKAGWLRDILPKLARGDEQISSNWLRGQAQSAS
jgi:hypothetical protein